MFKCGTHFVIYIFLLFHKKMPSRGNSFSSLSTNALIFYHSTKYPLGFQGPMIKHCNSISPQYCVLNKGLALWN